MAVEKPLRKVIFTAFRSQKQMLELARQQALPSSTGWLISLTRDFVLFFIRDTRSQMSYQDVMTQLLH
tara:strand:- start:437 stop:640 length:204 start_codon:yes stop_codon:yes gene_type:complete